MVLISRIVIFSEKIGFKTLDVSNVSDYETATFQMVVMSLTRWTRGFFLFDDQRIYR